MREKIAIIGAGVSGSYLYRLLLQEGIKADIFDQHHETKCGINSCAWITNKQIYPLIKNVGLNPEDFILTKINNVYIDGKGFKSHHLIIDKPKLLSELRYGLKPTSSKFDFSFYDRIIDATGVSRSFLPAISNDLVTKTIQFRLLTQNPHKTSQMLNINDLGFVWCCNLGNNTFHVGCVSFLRSPEYYLDNCGFIDSEDKILCKCKSNIRLASPYYSQPFVTNKVFGIGEAIGCVSPLSGEGIVPSMKSAELLFENWQYPQEYTKAILKEFSWMKAERHIWDKALQGKGLSIIDFIYQIKNAKRFGTNVGLKELITFLKGG
jgi:flavin-dependent dehydrogenase